MATAQVHINNDDVNNVEIITSAAAMLAADKAQIDVQIATAKQYPRVIKKALEDALALATLDRETAESMHYALPRKDKDGNPVLIEGESIRFAEVILYSWGNVRAEKKVISVDDKYVTAQGTFLDLEKNVGFRAEVKRRITTSNGRRYSEDMIQQTGNAAASIAVRNAILAGIPGAVVKRVSDAAKRLATGGDQPIEERRRRALLWFQKLGAGPEKVFALLGVQQSEEITDEHLQQLVALKNAIQDGEATIDSAFGDGAAAGESNASQASANLSERLRTEAAKASPAQPKAEPEKAPAAEPADDAAAQLDAAKAEVVRYVSALKPGRGDATDGQRDGIRERALRVFGDTDEKEAIFTAAAWDKLGKGQAGLLIMALDKAIEIIQPKLI